MVRLGGTLVLAALAAAACTGGDDTAPTSTVPATTTTIAPQRSNDGTLHLGIYLPRTGNGAPLGEPMIAAVEATIAAINDAGGVLGGDVEYTIVDEGASTGPSELLAAGVDAIVGPASSLAALSQFDVAVQASSGVVVCSPSATALSLDEFPDNGFFFRTVPSDSLQMAAIARSAERTGVTNVAIGHLDDPYGRGLARALAAEIDARDRVEIVATVGFGGDQGDLSQAATDLLADEPGVVIVLGDADDGSRLLPAIDTAAGSSPPEVIVNDSIRSARQTIQALSPALRSRLTGVAPLAVALNSDGPDGFFAAHAIDCVNLIALASEQAGSDAPSRIRANMASASTGGRVCTDFAACRDLLAQDLQIDYNGASGGVELSTSTGDPVRAWFQSFGFDAEGLDGVNARRFEVP